jgi:CRP-like cAMP-binding protein
VPPFAALPAEDLALLVERATPREFAPGEVIIARGSTVEAMHVVVEGTLVEERAGRPWAVREPYEIVGGVDALAGSSTELEVRAKGPARTLEMKREALLEVCYDRFEVLNAIVTGVAGMAIAAGSAWAPPRASAARPPRAASARRHASTLPSASPSCEACQCSMTSRCSPWPRSRCAASASRSRRERRSGGRATARITFSSSCPA